MGMGGWPDRYCGLVKEALNKLIPLMVRQAHHERNQQLAVRPEMSKEWFSVSSNTR